jgi:L-cysteate sulfo-lyase
VAVVSDVVRLGSWPTPLDPAPRLARRLGLRPEDLWIKRDDLVGLGGGGNKVRKLEHTCALAFAHGATTLVTTGAAQSNHARLTAAAGARLGLDVVLVLEGDPPQSAAGNLLLDGLLGARLLWAGNLDMQALAARAEQEAQRLRAAGTRVEVIPFGGSSTTGARGYVSAAAELLEQVPDLATVVVAVGSGGTMAGLVHGLGPARVLGVDAGAVADPLERVLSLVHALRQEDARLHGRVHTEVSGGELRLSRTEVGAGYAHLGESVRAAMRLVASTEGVILDPVYTGRAAAGLVAAVAEGSITPGQRTVLLHSGGLPGLFGHSEARLLWTRPPPR